MQTIEKIREVIEKEMPALVGSEFKQILTQWEKLKDENPKLKEEIKELTAFKNTFEHDSAMFANMDSNLKEREKKVEIGEKNLEVAILKKTIELTEASRSNIYSLVDKVFGNSRLFEHTTSTKYVPSHQGEHGWVNDRTETTTSETTKE